MYREIIELKNKIIIAECYKANEICMYNKSDSLCYHGDTEQDSIGIIKQYCKDNKIDISELEFNSKEDYLNLRSKGLFDNLN